MSKTYARVGIALGVILLFIGALDARGHYGVWAASWVLLGLFLILFGSSFFVRAERQKLTRRVSFGFLGVGVVLLVIALVFFRS